MAKRMLADVLWTAANEWLSPTAGDRYGVNDMYSCYAVTLAISGRIQNVTAPYLKEGNPAIRQAITFLLSLGMTHNSDDCESWRRMTGAKLQGVRYMWLLLAMHVAEDEGITV